MAVHHRIRCFFPDCKQVRQPATKVCNHAHQYENGLFDGRGIPDIRMFSFYLIGSTPWLIAAISNPHQLYEAHCHFQLKGQKPWPHIKCGAHEFVNWSKMFLDLAWWSFTSQIGNQSQAASWHCSPKIGWSLTFDHSRWGFCVPGAKTVWLHADVFSRT